ncbi:efflux RND transporter periplasmic adaptor subunit [Nocardioides lianchengensis]|uniref:Membrane fusion protein, macrolide-specific efflux system n=1 Tax=Nocardioides lianchengensis TaxID=1045774 RepID=A0A1G6N0K5_9ACTN|nr:efflux RND transporter periplasmic adaptor subunit [Nocardioides lianchengensis]NYG10603.1 macrolide-specific efflux system membrane fusion protein [Nocardioides lianchengensis]SDC61004.1 membrane fusion protein, macrolide-specific efflux system [Nocardioides lianchengensis]
MPRLFRRIWRGRTRHWLAVPVVLLLATGATGAWLLTRGEESAAVEPTTATVSAETVRETVAATGTVSPARSADLDFEVSGTVTRVFVAEGDRVRKGQALARVDASALVAQRTAAIATLDAAYTQLDEDQDAGASDTQLAADQAAIVAAEGSAEEARAAVRDATLRATIGGTVVSLDLAKGDVVGSGGGSSAGGGASTGSSTTVTTTTSAVSIVSTKRFVVEATVAAADVEKVTEGLQAEITPNGATEVVYGTVSDVGLVAEANSSGAAVFPVSVEVTGTQDGLYAGTSADVSIIVKQTEGVLTVPSRALTTEDDATYVTKVVDGEEVKTEVETGTAYGMTTEVVSGLVEGDVVEIPGFTRPTGGGEGDGGQQMPDFGGGQMPDFGGGQMPGGSFPGAPS